MVHPPPLCVGLPVRNGEDFLADALESLLGQSFSRFEVVISDNASTDGTQELCRAFAQRDKRILYSRTDANIGAGPNFNLAFSRCQSPFFKWMAHDDMLEPNCLERLMAEMTRDPGIVVAHTIPKLVDDHGEPLLVSQEGRVLDAKGRFFHRLERPHLAESKRATQRFAEVLRHMNWCTAIFGVMRTEALAQTHLHGSYYEGDRVLLAEMALLGRFIQLDEPLYIKRCHGGVSVLKSYQEQSRMIDPAVAPGPKGLRLRLGYAKALTVGHVSLAARLACAGTAVRVSLRNRVTTKLLTHLREPPPSPGSFA